MADPEDTATAPEEKGPLSAWMLIEERGRIVEALARSGFSSPSDGMRRILLAFVESDAVRQAVAEVERARVAQVAG